MPNWSSLLDQNSITGSRPISGVIRPRSANTPKPNAPSRFSGLTNAAFAPIAWRPILDCAAAGCADSSPSASTR